MKRKMFILCCVLFVFVAMVPVGEILLARFGYTLELFSVPVFSVGLAGIAVCIVVLNLVYQHPISNKGVCVLLALVTPLSIIGAFCCIMDCNHILVLASGAVCVGCCFYLTIKHAKPLWLKTVAVVLSVLLGVPCGLFSVFGVLFPMNQKTVVQTKESPSGRYYAEVIDNDQGALGGDTLVYVYENWECNLILFKVKKTPQQVYWGEWGAFKDMEIDWKNDRCLVIDSTEYEID